MRRSVLCPVSHPAPRLRGRAYAAAPGVSAALVVAALVVAALALAGSACGAARPAAAPLPSIATAIARTEASATARLAVTVDRPGAAPVAVEGVTSFVEHRAAVTASSPAEPGVEASVKVTPGGVLVRTAPGGEWIPVGEPGTAGVGAWITPLDELAAGRVAGTVGPERVRGDPAVGYRVVLSGGREVTVTIDRSGRIRRVVSTSGEVRSSVELYDFGAAVPDDP